jgi:murein DD-endopeptidase MepM/ murein hydrolase activator NlpD
MDRATRGLRIAAPPRLLSGYQWPLPRGILTLPFGPSPWGSRVVNGQLFHDGIDVATVCGDPIVAAHDGVVLTAGRRFDQLMGWVGDLTPYLERLDAEDLWWTLPIVIVIDDGNGYRSIYAHLSRVSVKKGQRVTAGQVIGYEGATGRASGCHLHYGLFSPHETETFAIDPGVVKRLKVPPAQIARIDPLLVLPPRPEDAPVPVAPGAQPGPDPSRTPQPPEEAPGAYE